MPAASAPVTVRFRVDQSYAALESAPCLEGGFLGLGWYEEQTSWEADAVHAAAAAAGVYVQHTLYNENANLVLSNAKRPGHQKNANSPFLKSNGGPLDLENCFDEFWVNPTVRAIVHDKLRYIVARWAPSRHFAMLELFNENPVAKKAGAITAWHAAVGEEWRQLNKAAGYNHLLTSSRYPFKGSAYGTSHAGISAPIASLDVAQVHAYPLINLPLNGQGNGAVGPLPLFFLNNTIGASRLPGHHKKTPLIWGEVGIDRSLRNGSSGADIEYDPHGASLHNPMWATAFGQGAGALFWYSDTYIAPRNLWYHFTGFRKFVDRVPWAAASLRPLAAELVVATPKVVVSALVEGATNGPSSWVKAWLWVRNAAYDSSWLLAHPGQTVPPLAAGLRVSLPCGEAGSTSKALTLTWWCV